VRAPTARRVKDTYAQHYAECFNAFSEDGMCIKHRLLAKLADGVLQFFQKTNYCKAKRYETRLR
jgi:hypothetical protein